VAGVDQHPGDQLVVNISPGDTFPPAPGPESSGGNPSRARALDTLGITEKIFVFNELQRGKNQTGKAAGVLLDTSPLTAENLSEDDQLSGDQFVVNSFPGWQPKPKNARRRFISSAIAAGLASEAEKFGDDPRPYWAMWHCGREVHKLESGEWIRHTCGRRFCLECSANDGYEMFRRYERHFAGGYFVTLTVPNVEGSDLSSCVRKMKSTLREICNEDARHRGVALRGLRKLECTVAGDGTFHPHFHLLLTSDSDPYWLVYEWLTRWLGTVADAQDVKPIDAGAWAEVAKYAAKFIKLRERRVDVSALYRIVTAFRGVRIIQPFGIRKGDPDPEVLQTSIQWVDVETAIWNQELHDWIDDRGTPVTGYIPKKVYKALVGSIMERYRYELPKDETEKAVEYLHNYFSRFHLVGYLPYVVGVIDWGKGDAILQGVVICDRLRERKRWLSG
jgi:hypothetical protein